MWTAVVCGLRWWGSGKMCVHITPLSPVPVGKGGGGAWEKSPKLSPVLRPKEKGMRGWRKVKAPGFQGRSGCVWLSRGLAWAEGLDLATDQGVERSCHWVGCPLSPGPGLRSGRADQGKQAERGRPQKRPRKGRQHGGGKRPRFHSHRCLGRPRAFLCSVALVVKHS